MFTVLSKSFDPKTQIAHEVSAYEVAGGCMVRSLTTVRENFSESLVFVPRSQIKTITEPVLNDAGEQIDIRVAGYKLTDSDEAAAQAAEWTRILSSRPAVCPTKPIDTTPVQGPDEVAKAPEEPPKVEPAVVPPEPAKELAAPTPGPVAEPATPVEPAADATEPAKE